MNADTITQEEDMKSVSHIILAALLSTGAAIAQDPINFDSSDTDDDGYLSNTEWMEIDDVSMDFNTLDTNSDGRLDRAEVNAGMQQQSQGAMTESASAQGGAQSGAEWQSTSGSSATAAQSSALGSSSQSTQPATIGMDDQQGMEETQASGETVSGGEDMRTSPAVLSGDEDAANRGTFDPSSYEGDDGTRFREDFDARDANADGMLDETEATNEDWIDINLFEHSDVNDDGLIDFGEAEDGFMEFGDDEQSVMDVEDSGQEETEEQR